MNHTHKTIITITPSWLIQKKSDFTCGVKTLKKLGFTVLAGGIPTKLPLPQQKARELHAACSRKDVDIVLAQRGGYSSIKMLPYVNFALIKRTKKVLAGFSDLSTLLNSVYERCGLVTLHAPMVLNLSEPSRFTVRSFMNAVNGFPEKNLFKGVPVTVYNNGVACGVLKGGNLMTLSSMIGTPWEMKTDNAVLFFEDVDEKPHAVDRYFTQWILAGKFKHIRGLILGDFRGVQPRFVYEVIAALQKIRIPVVYTPYIGHVKNKLTLPVGARVELNTKKKALTIL